MQHECPLLPGNASMHGVGCLIHCPSMTRSQQALGRFTHRDPYASWIPSERNCFWRSAESLLHAGILINPAGVQSQVSGINLQPTVCILSCLWSLGVGPLLCENEHGNTSPLMLSCKSCLRWCRPHDPIIVMCCCSSMQVILIEPTGGNYIPWGANISPTLVCHHPSFTVAVSTVFVCLEDGLPHEQGSVCCCTASSPTTEHVREISMAHFSSFSQQQAKCAAILCCAGRSASRLHWSWYPLSAQP